MNIFHALNICVKNKGNNVLIIFLKKIEPLFLFILMSKIKIFFMRFFLFLLLGIIAGLYLSWPGLLIPENWKCFHEIIAKSTEDKISFKAALEIFRSYLLKVKTKNVFKNKNRSGCTFSLIC